MAIGVVDILDVPHRRGVILADEDIAIPFTFSDVCNADPWKWTPGQRVEFNRCNDARDRLRAVAVRPVTR